MLNASINSLKGRTRQLKCGQGGRESQFFRDIYKRNVCHSTKRCIYTKSCPYLLDGYTRRIWNEFSECLTLINKHEILEWNIWMPRIPSYIQDVACLSSWCWFASVVGGASVLMSLEYSRRANTTIIKTQIKQVDKVILNTQQYNSSKNWCK